MKKEVGSVKYYSMKDDSLGPQCDYYLTMIEKETRGGQSYSFVLFGLLENGDIKLRNMLNNSPSERAHELIEVI
jgi:hypothetical protein